MLYYHCHRFVKQLMDPGVNTFFVSFISIFLVITVRFDNSYRDNFWISILNQDPFTTYLISQVDVCSNPSSVASVKVLLFGFLVHHVSTLVPLLEVWELHPEWHCSRVLILFWVDPLLKIVQERGKTKILEFMYI